MFVLAERNLSRTEDRREDVKCFISKLMKQPTAGDGILGQHHPGSSTIRA